MYVKPQQYNIYNVDIQARVPEFAAGVGEEPAGPLFSIGSYGAHEETSSAARSAQSKHASRR